MMLPSPGSSGSDAGRQQVPEELFSPKSAKYQLYSEIAQTYAPISGKKEQRAMHSEEILDAERSERFKDRPYLLPKIDASSSSTAIVTLPKSSHTKHRPHSLHIPKNSPKNKTDALIKIKSPNFYSSNQHPTMETVISPTFYENNYLGVPLFKDDDNDDSESKHQDDVPASNRTAEEDAQLQAMETFAATVYSANNSFTNPSGFKMDLKPSNINLKQKANPSDTINRYRTLMKQLRDSKFDGHDPQVIAARAIDDPESGLDPEKFIYAVQSELAVHAVIEDELMIALKMQSNETAKLRREMEERRTRLHNGLVELVRKVHSQHYLLRAKQFEHVKCMTLIGEATAAVAKRLEMTQTVDTERDASTESDMIESLVETLVSTLSELRLLFDVTDEQLLDYQQLDLSRTKSGRGGRIVGAIQAIEKTLLQLESEKAGGKHMVSVHLKQLQALSDSKSKTIQENKRDLAAMGLKIRDLKSQVAVGKKHREIALNDAVATAYSRASHEFKLKVQHLKQQLVFADQRMEDFISDLETSKPVLHNMATQVNGACVKCQEREREEWKRKMLAASESSKEAAVDPLSNDGRDPIERQLERLNMPFDDKLGKPKKQIRQLKSQKRADTTRKRPARPGKK